MNELEGVELDEAVARVLGVEPGAAYTTDWSHGGPLIERFAIHLNGPESRVHRNGGPKSGWGQSGFWTCTSWHLRKADGHRAIGYHDTSPLIAAMRMVAECSLTPNVERNRPAGGLPPEGPVVDGSVRPLGGGNDL